MLDRAFGVDKINLFRNQINLAKSDIQRTIDEINKIIDADQTRQHARGALILSKYSKLNNLNAQAPQSEGRTGRGEPVKQIIEDLSTIDRVIESNRESIDSFYRALEKGGLNSATEQELRLQLQLYDELEGKLYDYQNRLREVLTGTSANNLTDMIADAFRNDSSAEDYANNFKKLMQDAVIQSLKLTALEAPLKEFYEKFAKETEGGLTAEKIAGLRKEYDAIINNAQKEFDTLKQVTGIDFGKDSSGSGMSKSIESITSTQADVLAGQVGGIHLAVVQNQTLHKNTYAEMQSHTGLLKQSYMVQMEIAENTKRTANNTDRLFAVEKHLEQINNKMNSDAAIRAGGGRI